MGEKIKTFNEVCKIVEQFKKEGQKVVLATGSFDILHIGHMAFLSKSKNKGDKLVVGVERDENIKRIKGLTRPVNGEEIRSSQLTYLNSVDIVFLLPINKAPDLRTFYVEKLYKKVKPDIITCSSKNSLNWEKIKEEVELAGCKFVDIHHEYHHLSSTNIIKELCV